MKKSTTFITTLFLLFTNCLLPTATYAQYTKLLDFVTTNGMNPYGSLISDGTFLYGMTSGGGTGSLGTLFKILPDGTGYVKLLDFAATTGRKPTGSLISDGTFLYGMTRLGGTSNKGTLFKILPDGTGYVKLLDFVGATNGMEPYGSLFYDGTFLYGMASKGGTNNLGTLFKILPDGTGYTKLLDFAGTTNGNTPFGELISDGTFLYGFTYNGGTNNMGTLFKILPDGTNYAKLLDFEGTTNGKNPRSSLIYDGTFLYGMTNYGGTNNLGTIFKILPDGTGYTKLLDFAGTTNGGIPEGKLISDGIFLFGMTWIGGTNNRGTLFKIQTDGTGYTKLIDFAAATNGSDPLGSLISDGTFVYGMTYTGGTANVGTVFKYQYCVPSTETDVQTACNSYTWINGTTYTANNNTATFNIIDGAANGCDSLVTLNLTIIQPTSSTQTFAECAGFSISVGTNTYNTTGVYTDVLMGSNGCDSIVTTDLTIQADTGSQTLVECEGFSVTVGTNTYNATGIYTDVLIGSNGCDSTVTTNLTIEATIDVTINNSLAPTLTANQAGASYQWLDCNNGNAIITSETSQNFTANINGNYAVEITVGSCSDTSMCENVTGVNVKEIANTNVSIYPTPTNGMVTINLPNSNSVINYTLTTIEGRIVDTGKTTTNNIIVDLSKESKGVYLLKLNEENINNVYKVVKQ